MGRIFEVSDILAALIARLEDKGILKIDEIEDIVDKVRNKES